MFRRLHIQQFFTAYICLAAVVWTLQNGYAGEQENGSTDKSSVAPVTEEELKQLVEQLDAPQFEQRESASRALRNAALSQKEEIQAPLVACYKNATSPEVRYRLYRVLLDLADGMRPDAKPGFLGILMMDSQVTLPGGKSAKSIIVRQVVAGSAAARAGLKLMDHIIAVDSKPMEAGATPADTASFRFSEYIRSKPAQAEVELEVYSSRPGKVRKVIVTLGERPDQYQDQTYKRKLANDVVQGWLRESRN